MSLVSSQDLAAFSLRAACSLIPASRWKQRRKMMIINCNVLSVKAAGCLPWWVVWTLSLLDDISSGIDNKRRWGLLRASVQPAGGPQIKAGVYDDWADTHTKPDPHQLKSILHVLPPAMQICAPFKSLDVVIGNDCVNIFCCLLFSFPSEGSVNSRLHKDGLRSLFSVLALACQPTGKQLVFCAEL